LAESSKEKCSLNSFSMMCASLVGRRRRDSLFVVR
jgi:hypothetical protein